MVDRISTNVKGKYIYIPNNITYAAPTSEKQFNGNIPAGSYIEVPRIDDLVYGVHWTNLPGDGKYQSRGFYGEIKPNGEERVDLDLKQMNKNEVFGWDASYRILHQIFCLVAILQMPQHQMELLNCSM